MPKYSVGTAQELPFADYSPDLDPATPGILLGMDGYVPTVKGYAARPSPTAFAPALPGNRTPTGGYVALFSDGTVKVYAAATDKLFRDDAGVWTQVGTGYTATSRWRFAQFNDDVIAVAAGVNPQVAAGAAGSFGALGGSPPANATNVLSISAAIVFMTQGPNWFSSAVGADNNWTPNIQTQANSGTFTDYPGPVVALAPLFRDIIVFKQESMLRGSFIGGQNTWSFQLLSGETGTMCQESVIVIPEGIAFLGTDDFYITTGYTPERIPNNFKENFFGTADKTLFSSMLSWYDHTNSICYWHYVSKTPPVAGVPDLWIAFNVRAKRWATGKLTTYYVVPNTQVGQEAGIYFDVNKVAKTWTGTPGQAFVLTGFFGEPGRLTQIMRVRPKYGAGAFPSGSPLPDLVIPFHTDVLGQVPTQQAAATRNVDGWHYYRAYDRYHQVQINTNGAAEIVGLAAEWREAGTR